MGTVSVPVVAVRVVLLGELRRLAGRREVELRLPAPASIRTLSRALGDACGRGFADRVLTTDGDLQSHVAVFLNGAQIPQGRDADAELTGGEVELMLMPMFEGG